MAKKMLTKAQAALLNRMCNETVLPKGREWPSVSSLWNRKLIVVVPTNGRVAGYGYKITPSGRAALNSYIEKHGAIE